MSRSDREWVFCFPVRDWEGVCRKILSLVFLNFQLLVNMMIFIFIEFTWKLGFLRWLNFAQENWLRGYTSCLHWKWLICFRIWCQTFPQKMWVLRSQNLQLLWLIGHSSSTRITNFWIRKYCKYQISTAYQENIVWTSLFLLGRGGRWIFYQIFEKKGGGEGGLTWSQ